MLLFLQLKDHCNYNYLLMSGRSREPKAKALQRATEGQLSITAQAVPLWSLEVACDREGYCQI